MNITFTAIGLTFGADVNYTPGDPGRTYGPPEYCYPAEPDELEFISLTCEGKDAMFLLNSTCADEIEQAACEGAREMLRRCADEALIDAYLDAHAD